tara:strand:+ start:191 stop:814 length:624 start_codon:yes stop_codon:yes gene_type:complete
MNEEIIPIFPVPVHISKYEKDLTKEQDFIKNISYVPNGSNGNFKSVNTFLLQSKELKKLKEFILSQLNIYTKTILLSSDILIPTISWTNKNPKGSRHHQHIHPNSIVSGVFYFSINDSAPIQFHKHDFGGIKLDSDKYNNYNNGMYSVKMNKSELVLFPSTTRHSVPENKSDEIRYSLSFNTFTDAVIGSTDKLTYLNLKELSNGNT